MNPKTHIILVVLGIVAAIIAAVSVRMAMSGPPETDDAALLPGFAARADDATEIEIRTADSTLLLARTADGWVLPDKTGIPAQSERVRALLIGLAELTPTEPKTADPAAYGRIGVDGPDAAGSRSTLVTVRGEGGAELASVILGNGAQGGTTPARFVRAAGEERSYLAPVSFDATTEVSQWTDRTLLAVPGDRVQSVVISHPDREEFAVSRETPEQTDFAVTPIPEGRTLRSPGIANPITRALTNLMFEDVRAGTSPLDPDASVSVVYQTFDGLVVALLIGDQEGEHWTTITVSAADPASPPEDYEALRARVAGRQFRLPTWAATNMSKRYDDLLAAPAAPAEEPAPGPLGPVFDPDG